MMKARILFGLLGLVAWMASTSARADSVYRWTDDSGVVNYGSAPPQAGLAQKTVRQVDVTPAVTDHVTPDELRARHDLAQALFAAEDARLQRELLEEQIASEHARAEAYRAQADMLAAQAQQTRAEGACADSGRCDASPAIFIAGGIHPRARRPDAPLFSHLQRMTRASGAMMHPTGERTAF